MSDKFKILAAVRLMQLTLYSDCSSGDADEITRAAISILESD